jgi:hypothetical protein
MSSKKQKSLALSVPRGGRPVDRNHAAADVPVVRSPSPARTPDSIDQIGDVPVPGIPAGPVPITTEIVLGVPLVEQAIPEHTPSERDVRALIADPPPVYRSPVARAFDAFAQDLGPVVASAFHTGARVDANAIAAAFDAAMSRGKGK